jgi:hypothetical protein
MKRTRFLLALLASAALGMSALAASPAPTLPIDQALKIAQDYLQQHGATGQVQIVGLTIEHASASVTYWYAKWSAAIEDGKKKENGLRIDMDGTITRFVDSPDSPSSNSNWEGEKPQGQRRMGARNIHGGGG